VIIRDLFFESGSTEATKIKQILQRYVIYISDQITDNHPKMSKFRGQVIIPTAHFSDSPLLRQPISPTTHYSDSPLLRQSNVKIYNMVTRV
jgi:hypothetical protein